MAIMNNLNPMENRTREFAMPEPIRLDPELTAKAEKLFRELGLDLNTALHLFLRQSLRENALPFTLRLTAPLASEDDTEHPEEDAAEYSHPQDDGQNIAVPVFDPSDIDEKEVELEGESFEPAGQDRSEAPAHLASEDEQKPDEQLSGLRQAFFDMGLLGTPLHRVRTLNQLYAIGEANPHVQGWREVYVSGDEPFALDFGSVRVELGWQGGGSIRMMDGRLPDEVLESDAVFPRELSPVFSSVIGQRLVDVSSTRVRRGQNESEQLRLRFANGSTLTFSPGENWGALWLSDAHGSVMFAPDAVWRRVLGERSWQTLR